MGGEEITIHSYAHAGVKGKRPRAPMVHLLSTNEYGGVNSVTFHPDDAPMIATAILDAGKAAAAGRKRKPIRIELKPHG